MRRFSRMLKDHKHLHFRPLSDKIIDLIFFKGTNFMHNI